MLFLDTSRGRHSRRLLVYLACLRSHVLRAYCNFESKRARLQYPNFCLHGRQRLKLRHDLDGCPLHFWPSERRNGTVNSYHAKCTRCKKINKELQSLSFILSDDYKWSIFDFFGHEPTLAVFVAKTKYMANFHTTNHVRSRWRNRLIRQLRVWPDGSRLCRLSQNKSLIIPRID